MKKPMKRRTKEKRITAGTLAILLALTGSFGSFPESAERFHPGSIHAYASDIETSSAEGETVADDFNAALGGIRKYFMKLGTRVFQTVTPGESLPDKTTFVSFDAEDGYYYLVRLAKDGEPQLPLTAAQALDDGWVRKVGTGTYVWRNLSWNRSYQVYELNLSESPASMKPLGSTETKKGITGGTVTITGDILTGNQITAKLENPTTEDGSFLWYSAASAGAADWTLLSEGAQGASLTIPDSIRGLYVKAVFTAAAGGDFEGSIEAVTSVPAATSLNRTVIAGRAEIGQKLTASTDPGACGPGVRYEWYRAAGETADAAQDQMVYTGNPYEIQPEDIGKRLYVKAVSLPASVSVGDKISDLTEPVIAVPYGAPSAPQVTGSGAESLTVRMPDGSEGFYELGYSVNEEADKSGSGSDFTLVQTKVRGINSAVIPGLASSTVYYIWARQCGEHGFTDSAWSSISVAGKTLPPALTGSLEFTGSSVYGETLTAALTQPGQNGTFHWYRNGTEEIHSPEGVDNPSVSEGTSTSYQLQKEDIGKQLKVTYEGKEDGGGSPSSGTLLVVSDAIEKISREKPAFTLTDGEVTKTDSSLSFTVPAVGETGDTVKIGYAGTAEGVPIPAATGLSAGQSALVEGLDRNQDYYLFFRYEETETHKESGWSEAAGPFKTERTMLEGAVTITFDNTAPNPGTKLTASLNGISGEVEGSWKWIARNSGGAETQVAYNQDVSVPEQTSYLIPEETAVGTVYVVSFTGDGGMTGTVTAESGPVKLITVETYEPPSAPTEKADAATDTSVTVAMAAGNEGVYQFGYGLSEDRSDLQIFTSTAYGDNNIEITGLNRNTVYYVWARRLSVDSSHETSDWSGAYLSARTGMTVIGGRVTLSGDAVNGQTLTATYESASYLPEGDDTGGTWSWKQEKGVIPASNFVINDQPGLPIYYDISGVTGNTYQLTKTDIGSRVTAVYTGPEEKGFHGEKTAESELVKKIPQAAPEKAKLTNSDLLADAVSMELSGLPLAGYYQIRKENAAIPTAPELSDDPGALGWKPCSGESISGNTEYYDPDQKSWKALEPGMQYVIYTVLPETEELQPSGVAVGDLLTSNWYLQSGSITYQSGQDTTAAGVIVVGGELQAKLSDAKGALGTWKWYVSTTADYTTGPPSPEEEGAWKQQLSGYSPTRDSTSSRLTLTADMLGKYIRAEFETDTASQYTGTIDGGTYKNFVKKIYKEKVKIESNTSDGNGNPKAYEGSVLTGTIENYAESGIVSPTLRTVQFLSNGTEMTGVSITNKGGSFSCTLPRNKEKDGQSITVKVSKPAAIELYVTDLYAAIDDTPLVSSTGIPYKDGIAISSEDDLKALMKAGNNSAGKSYSSRSEAYVITKNIQCNSKVAFSSSSFTGSLDGDYHTVTGLQNPLFKDIGKNAKMAVICNLIFNNAAIETNASGSMSDSAAVLSQTVNGNTKVSRVFISQASVLSGWHSGNVFGRIESNSGTITIDEVSTAGGTLATKVQRNLAGIAGLVNNDTTLNANNVSTLKSTIVENNWYIAGLTHANGTVNSQNILVASIMPEGSYGVGYGSDIASYNGKAEFFDSTLTPLSDRTTPGVTGTPKTTQELIGTQLKSAFDQNLSADAKDTWTYADGYYPRLTWIADHPVTKMFAATRGAFTSVDGKTGSDDMFNGNIHGVIEIPNELQAEGYTYESSDTGVLEVTESGTIIPVGTGTATITVHYEDDGSVGIQADNTFEFTVGSDAVTKAFDSLTVSGTPDIGRKLIAAAAPSTASGLVYQWYRRLNGTTVKELIYGEVSDTYTVKGTDAGYELCVEVAATGYGKTTSPFTQVVQVTAPSSPPSVVLDAADYQKVTVTGQGGLLDQYEFAYSTAENGEKNVLEFDADKYDPVSREITGLEANRDYWFYSRIPAGTGYSASPWSSPAKIKTNRIPLEGGITLNGDINVGRELTARMQDTNLQTGTWKVERVNGASTTDITADNGNTQSGTYVISRILTGDDVGCTIRFTFTGTGDFTGTASADSQRIEKSMPSPPSTAPTVKAKTDSSVTLEAYSGNLTTDLSIYEYGYKKTSAGEIIPADHIETVTAPPAQAGIKIGNLSRNTSYSFYVRQRENDGYVTSNWSPACAETTDKTDIGTMGKLLTFNKESAAVEDIIRVSAPSGLTGSWGLEKVKNGQKATLSGFWEAEDHLMVEYTLTAGEAGYTIEAVFAGTGDFTGEIRTSMGGTITEKQYDKPGDGSFTVLNERRTDSTLTVQLAQVIPGSYQFGWRPDSTGAITECQGSVRQGNTYTVTGLSRNKAYQIVVRRLEETGYVTSEWSAAVEGTTDKTKITGEIQITGTAQIGSVLTAEYQGGYYAQNGLADDKGGTYTWTAEGVTLATGTDETCSYQLTERERGKSISVTYEAAAGSDFQGERTKLAGTVAKAATTAPANPVLSPQTNTEQKSTLKITNAVAGAWYIPVKYDSSVDTRPELVMESAAQGAGWKQAAGMELELPGLDANTDYIVYGACLETDTAAASQLSTSVTTRTLKEEITAGAAGSGSTGLTGPAQLKPMDGEGTSVSIAVYGKAPTGTWYWYVSKTAGGAGDGWKLIRTETHEEAADAVQAFDIYKIPYEYSGYYLKVEFHASGDYTGKEIYQPPVAIADRELTGSVSISPDSAGGNQRLFEILTASYTGTDDGNGTWTWQRRESDNSWSDLSAKLYTSAGPESSYTPTQQDSGKLLKAVYQAGSFGCTGTKEAETGEIGKAVQNQPAAPKISRISGTNITLTDSDPGRAGPYGTRPEAEFGYRKSSDMGAEITWPPEGTVTWTGQEARIRLPEPSAEYVFYTKYKENMLYLESAVSEGLSASTGAGVLYQSNLNLLYDESEGEAKKLDVGRTVTAVYQGEGWDKGSFTVKRSDGQEIPEADEGVPNGYTVQTDEAGERISCSYKLPAGMAGFSLTFVYTAKADSGYSGSVEILTGAVKKPAGAPPVKAELRKNLDTDFYLINVTDSQEYAMVKELSQGVIPEEPGRNSSLWQSLSGDSAGEWHYTGLERGTTYYVYTRRAETTEHEVSESVVSEPVTTESFLYMGEIRLINEQDVTTQPVGIGISQEIPSTLNGTVTVDSICVLEKGGDNEEALLNATERMSEFVNDSGGVRYLNPNVYEKGSNWANGRFATTLRLAGGSGQYAELESGERSTFSAGDTMILAIYRANAVTEGGSYWWEITLKDDEGTEALLKADVTIITQMKATVPLRIALQIRDREIRQTTNGAGLKNSNGMPVEVSVDEKPGAGTGMPELLGEPVESDPQRMEPGAVYLKLSVDGSIETGQVTDLWLNTTLPSAVIRPLIKLGASSQADYYISGIISENGTVNWPWPSDGSQTIQEAYQLKFIYEISADGYPVYTPKISSPDTITGLQEGGES